MYSTLLVFPGKFSVFSKLEYRNNPVTKTGNSPGIYPLVTQDGFFGSYMTIFVLISINLRVPGSKSNLSPEHSCVSNIFSLLLET